MKRRAGAAAGAGLLLVLLSGCAGPPTANELTGSWRDQDGAVHLVLRADGSCSAHLLQDEGEVVSGTCRWTVRPHDDRPLRLDFSGDARAEVGRAAYRVRGSSADAVVYQYLDGDPSTTVDYRR